MNIHLLEFNFIQKKIYLSGQHTQWEIFLTTGKNYLVIILFFLVRIQFFNITKSVIKQACCLSGSVLFHTFHKSCQTQSSLFSNKVELKTTQKNNQILCFDQQIFRETEEKHLIYNYNPQYVGRQEINWTFQQAYLF